MGSGVGAAATRVASVRAMMGVSFIASGGELRAASEAKRSEP